MELKAASASSGVAPDVTVKGGGAGKRMGLRMGRHTHGMAAKRGATAWAAACRQCSAGCGAGSEASMRCSLCVASGESRECRHVLGALIHGMNMKMVRARC